MTKTFFGLTAEYFKSFNERLFKRNRDLLFILSCLLLNQATKAFVRSLPPWPMNFCVAITAPPGSGKGLLKHLLYPLLSNTGIYLLSKGSPEGISDLVAEKRNCILIWDEAGEIVSDKSGQYRSIDKLFNVLYDLDSLGKHVVSRAARECPAWEYYTSVIFVCTDKQWRSIVSKFKEGGFPRRFLQLRLKRYREPFEIRALDEKTAELAGRINAFIAGCRNLCVEVNLPEFPNELKEDLRNIPEGDRDLVEAYTVKAVVSCVINSCLTEEVMRSCGHGEWNHSIRGMEELDKTDVNFMTIYDHHLSLYDLNDLVPYDLKMTSMTNMTNSLVMNPFLTKHDLMTIFSTISNMASSTAQFVDEHLSDIVDKLSKLRDIKPVMTRKEFSRTVLSGCPSDRYMAVIRALQDMEEARYFKHPKRDWAWVVINPDWPTCPNCACWQDGLCTLYCSEEDRYKKRWKIRWHKGDKCEDFVPLKEVMQDE